MKHTANNKNSSPVQPQAELLATVPNSKPISNTHATAAQLRSAFPFLAGLIDETFLRNRAREINPRTGAGWIPKPRNNQFEIQTTLIGLLEWFTVKAASKSDLPTQYANMSAMENALGTDKKAIKWLLKNGAGEAQDQANRIAPLPVIRRAFEIIAKVSEGSVTGIDGLEQWNKDTELAKKLREDRLKLEDDRRIREGDLKCEADVEGVISEKLLMPLRAALLHVPKTINRQHKTIYTGDGLIEDKLRKSAAVTTAAVAVVLDKIRAKIPATKPTDE